MNGLFVAADQVQECCLRHGWGFCFIGGLAVQRWGEPRITRDVDLTVLTGFGDEAAVAALLASTFEARIDDVVTFAVRARVVLLRTAGGVPIDVSLGALPFEERTVQRSSEWPVAGARPLRTCSAEDLVVHKAFAGRDRDWADVAGVVARRGDRLDRALITAELAPLLELKGDVRGSTRLDALLDATDE